MLRLTGIWSGTQQGLPYYSTMYTGGTTQSDADAARAAFNGFWDGIKTLITTGLSVTLEPDVEIVDTPTGQVTGTFTTLGGTTAGTASGDVLGPTQQGLLRLRTGTYSNGREVRGRWFIPGAVEGSNTLGAPVVGYTTLVAAEGQDLITALVGNGSLVIYSPTYGTATVVNSASCWNRWAVLRSRRD